ncbi:MAG: GNAT family N-acetyltransferase, partial [Verrucomicrobiae bacterium]|nr:GNAT family N-acetyltransferase [Verrucomicrobiae bacterium]
TENDRIVGFCHVAPSRDGDSDGTAEITALYVHPSFWRLGHGRSLCDEALSHAGKEAFPEISLWVIAENRRARHFYERAGFFDDGGFKSVERPGFVLKEVRYRRKTTAADANSPDGDGAPK